MTARCLLPLVLVTLVSPVVASRAQTPSSATDGVAALLFRVEEQLGRGTTQADAFAPFYSPSAPAAALREFFEFVATQGATRAVVRERDRAPLDGTLPGDGYRLIVDLFTETPRRARIVTARIDVRRPRGGPETEWRIAGAERLSMVDGLHRLSVDGGTQLAARNLEIAAEDFVVALQDGNVFVVDSADGVTGLVLIGRGEIRFTPPSEAERGQLRVFGGDDSLTARFEVAFVRLNPAEYESRMTPGGLTKVPVDPRLLRRARQVFAEEAPKSFSLDLSDLSRDPWYLIPAYGDFLAEVRTRRHGTLTYARSTGEAEDITLFDRERHRNISLYASPQKLSARGRFYDEDDLTEYDVLDYDIEANISPDREFITGRTRMRVRIRAFALASMTIRLAEPLTVSAVASVEHGRLLHLRVKNQNSIVVNLPTAMARDNEITLVILYSGRLASQNVEGEALQGPQPRFEEPSLLMAERNYLLSNRSYWHPQGQVSDYATATLRITVPDGYGCVASGEVAPGSPVTMTEGPAADIGKRRYVFTAVDPIRYVSVLVSRFTRVMEAAVPLVEGAERNPLPLSVRADGSRTPGFRVRDRIGLTVEANPRQQSRGREAGGWAADILAYYASIMGEAPYSTMTIAVVEHNVPGGHSPAYFAMLNSPLPTTPLVWRNDPAAFNGFPEFFLAHEIAHQWWGQAVGWKNYHEQWISEGFAQYFAALYARKAHGEATFTDMLRQFRRWSLSESGQGPVYLGYRLGHIRGDQRVFRALLYNKGAAVLHMLRRLVGDEAFFNSLRRFYDDRKFAKAGTDDLQRAFEKETGLSLERFFERWIYGSALPRLRFATAIAEREVTVRFEQVGDLVFDVPVTVTIALADGRTFDTMVAVTEKEMVHRIPVDSAVRSVQVNRDSAAIAHFEQS